MLTLYSHLLEKGADVSIPDAMGDTVAHWAAYYGEIDLLAALLKTGTINVCDKDSLGQTAMHIAALQGQVSTVKYLVDHGPESLLYETDLKDRTPRQLAEQRSLDAITQLLRNAETNLKERMKKERKSKKSIVIPLPFEEDHASASHQATEDSSNTPTTPRPVTRLGNNEKLVVLSTLRIDDANHSGDDDGDDAGEDTAQQPKQTAQNGENAAGTDAPTSTN